MESGKLSFRQKIGAIVKSRKRKFHEHIIRKFDEDKSCANFYKHVNSLLGVNQRPRWSPRNMYPNHDEEGTTEILATYFNSISSEYQPLIPATIQRSFDREELRLTEAEVADKLKSCKKSNSTVPGDINPKLYNQYSELLAKPVTFIYNCIISKKTWPQEWKKGHVTIIPKCRSPQLPSECRTCSQKFLRASSLGGQEKRLSQNLTRLGEKKEPAQHTF